MAWFRRNLMWFFTVADGGSKYVWQSSSKRNLTRNLIVLWLKCSILAFQSAQKTDARSFFDTEKGLEKCGGK